jgi:hypothetical protein
LGPADEALHRRLLDDGALWRAGLPSTERLEQHLKTLAPQEPITRPDAAARSGRSRLRLIKRPKGDASMLHGRLRMITAVAAIAAVVVLFVVLFQGFGLGHGHTTGTSKTATPTLSPAPSPTPEPDQSYRLPVIAPSNPQIVYRMVLASGSAVQLVLQRSADGGASWHTFALPAQSNGPQPTIFVSPLDAQAVFVTLGGTLVNTSCVPQRVGSSSTLSSGANGCGLQYLSQDGGAHWTQLRLPPNEILSGFSGGLVGDPQSSLHTLQAQGTRLYSTLGPWTSDGYGAGGSTSPQIVTSNDGGATWQVVDNGLPLTADTLCDVAPAPAGSTVFALLSSPTGCVAQPLTLWRSDDAGAHWAEVTRLQNDVLIGMAVVSSSNAAQPLLYLNTASSSCSSGAYIASSPLSGICNGAPTNLQVSADGGKTWQDAPTQGYPDSKLNPGLPRGVLSDGAVLFLVDFQFYTWKAGEAAWQQVGPSVSADFQYALVTWGSAGQQTLWVVMSSDSSNYVIKGYPI